jgi:outer membrane protein TolC
LVLSVVSLPAWAQGPIPQPVPDVTGRVPQALPNQGAANLPPPLVVNDPDLVPLPPAKRMVRSWDEITQYLRARSSDLRIAIDEVGRAEAQRRVAWAGVLGSINGSVTLTHNFLGVSQFSNVDSAAASLAGSLPILAPRAWNAIHSAGVNIGVQRASLDDIKRTISTTVANDALTVVTDEHIAELNRVGLRQALERLELARRKTSLGAGTGLDVVRAQQDVENARATLVTGDENAREAREAFGLSLGVPEDVSVAGDLSFEAITTQVLSQCKPAPSIEDRPDVVAARERVHAAKLQVWDVWTQFVPTITLNSTLSTQTTSNTFVTGNSWNIQGVLAWDIWDGGARYGNLRDTKLQVLEAQDRLDSVRRTATIQVVQAQRGVQVATQSREVASRARDLAAEVDRLTRAGFMTGQGTSLDLVTAAAALRQAEINLALADFGLIKAKILAVLALATCPI